MALSAMVTLRLRSSHELPRPNDAVGVRLMSTITLGPARIGDAPRIANMSRALIEPGLPWSWTPRRVAAHMREREHLTIVAKEGTDLAGFVLAQFGAETVHLALLGVEVAYRRNGIGRQLVKWVEDTAVIAGLFMVRLEVRSTNHSARRFYASLGYSESGSAAGYYSGVEDAIKLTHDLRAAAPWRADNLKGPEKKPR
jgi:ribosomal protein S18 acetylase RimI-like enzyme